MANLDGRAAPLFEGVRSVFPGPAISWRRVSPPLRATAKSGRQEALKQDATGSNSAG